ncbi:MAG: hypothetical protein ACHQ50_13555 [Fimbriimonadales bacterium]
MTAQWNDIPAPTGKEARSRLYPAGYRTDVIDVPIQGNNGQLEYMIRMKAEETVVYSWEVLNNSNPHSFYTEFHGHTEAAPGRPGDLMFYEKASGSTASGSLVAPWPGIHGWYWQNKSDAPVVVRLRMAGFYELIPGQAGQPVTSMAGETHAP